MAFSLSSGVTAYAAKSAVFCYTCEHAHTGTRPRGLRRAVMRLRVYSDRFVIFSIIIIIINPRRACAARVTVVGLSVCLFVCLSVCLFDYSRTTGYEAAYER